MKRALLAITILLLLFGAAVADSRPMVLWYDRPATNWEKEALPIGNGRLGAMVFGGTENERVQFNVDSLWTGDQNPSGVYETAGMGAYQNFGDLYVDFEGDGAIEAYRRELDIANALCRVSYEKNGTRFTRETFCSHPDQVIVIRLSANAKGKYAGRIRLKGGHGEKTSAVSNKLTVAGKLANGLEYEAQMIAVADGGKLETNGDELVFSQSDGLTLYLTAGTSYVMDYSKKFVGENPHELVTRQVDVASKKSHDAMREANIAAHRALFDRVTIDLGKTADSQRNLPMDQRLQGVREGAADPDLEELLFQYGRYLLIACSRPGTLPANLQGVWNNRNNPPWRSDYHSNINLQMNYWLAEPTNLAECHKPMFDLLLASLEPCRKATRKSFGEDIRGFTVRTSHNPFGGMGWKWNIPASAWYAQHFWEHYAFGRDKDFLRNTAYPYMKEACEFWEDHLKELDDGTLVAPNGWSPEHGPVEDGVSHDQQIIWDLFSNTILAAEALNVDKAYRTKLTDMRDRLAGPKIGKWGQLQEWMVDRDSPNNHHRHISHMFAAFPGRQISPWTTPELARAASVSAEARGQGADVGWSNAWKINLWARLGHREKAYWHVNRWISRNTFDNLLNACWPGKVYQVEGNFGYTSGICEMLLQSHMGEIHFLPTLPDAWPDGSVTGLRARGGIQIDIEWKDGKATGAVLKATVDGKHVLRAPKGQQIDGPDTVEMKAGQTREVRFK